MSALVSWDTNPLLMWFLMNEFRYSVLTVCCHLCRVLQWCV